MVLKELYDNFFFVFPIEYHQINPFPPSVPIRHRLAKHYILILEGIVKKFSMSVATMSR